MFNYLFKFFGINFSNELILNYEKVKFNSDIIYKKKYIYTVNNYSNELFDINTKSTFEIYSLYTRFQKKIHSLLFETYDVAPDLYILKPGKLKREYFKTLSSCAINFDTGESKEILFQVLSGSGYFLLENIVDRKQVKFIKVKKNDIILIPKNWAFIMINNNLCKNFIAICLRNRSVKIKNNIFEDMGGAFVFYTINGFIKNKNTSPYYHLDEYSGDYLEDYQFNKNIGIYDEFIKFPEKFNFLK